MFFVTNTVAAHVDDYSHSTKMLFKFSTVLFAATIATFLFAGQTNAVADNDVDACNGSNHYDVGHDCAFGESQGTCQLNSCQVLVCVPNAN
ncbi:hypothetical protein BDZ89DRAFT_1066424 [Hymenopellis radicata]|nr:hypothetical protein BDZ89DRAFT_1066424 [Hymenopellis radicata]